jgi:peptidoglycan/xylan/chitin deacetylase (PgdA/CDA1 family)
MAAVIATDLPTLTVAQWCASTHPSRAVVLTFDDGHVSNYTLTLPILLEHHLRPFLLTVGAIGKEQRWIGGKSMPSTLPA